MCEKCNEAIREYHKDQGTASEQTTAVRQIRTIYELKQKREDLIIQLVVVQKAIDAVNMVS